MGESWITLAGALLAIGVLTALGSGVGVVICEGARKPEPPKGLPPALERELLGGADGGELFGLLERTLLFGAFWTGAAPLVAAWYGFKLASKWEVWKNVIKLPEDIVSVESADWSAFRHAFGSWVLQRFWIGTALNTLLALGCSQLGRHAPSLLGWG